MKKLLLTGLAALILTSACSVSAESVTMYSADGRTISIDESQVEEYKAVFWYTEPPVLMYAADGRTLYVIPSEVELYKAVGWYTEKPVLMYSIDGRTLYVIPSEVELYKTVGWYASQEEAQRAKEADLAAKVKAILPVAHKEFDGRNYKIVDNSYEVLDENEAAYLIAFNFSNYDEVNFNPYYIIDKNTGEILDSGALQDYWPGMIDDMLYGNGAQGSARKRL